MSRLHLKTVTVSDDIQGTKEGLFAFLNKMKHCGQSQVCYQLLIHLSICLLLHEYFSQYECLNAHIDIYRSTSPNCCY